MSKVLHVLVSDHAHDVYVTKTVSGSNLWLSFDVWFQAGLPPTNGQQSAFIGAFNDAGGGVADGEGVLVTKSGGNIKWWTHWSDNGPFSTLTTGTWYHVDINYAPGTQIVSELDIDGADQGVDPTGVNDTDAITGISLGAVFPGGWETAYELYIANPRVGTTRNGTDVWSSDLNGLIGSIFTSTTNPGTNTIAIINNPTGSEPPGEPAGGGGGIPLTGSPYTGHAPTFTVVNMDHTGAAASTITPVGNSLEWTYRLAQVGGPGDAGWEVALSDPVLTADQFAPYRTDWKLVMDGANALCAGIVTSVNMLSESDSGVFGVVRCQGLDWLHYLEQPYGFDYSDVASDQLTNQLSEHDRLWRIFTTSPSGGVAGVTYSATQGTVVSDLIGSVSGYTGAVGYTVALNGSGWGEGVNMNVGFGDDSTILDMVVSLASLDTPYGFDMFVDPDKTIELYAPRRVTVTGATAIYTLNDSTIVAPPLDWTNNGPHATDTVMLGIGSSNTRTVGFSSYAASQTMYRQWVRIGQENFPDTVDIGKAADGAGYWDRFPHKDLKLTIRPDLLDPTDARLGFTNMLGEVVAVNYDVTPYHHINANFWVTEQHYYSPDGCNWLADFTLSQIYTTSSTPSP